MFYRVGLAFAAVLLLSGWVQAAPSKTEPLAPEVKVEAPKVKPASQGNPKTEAEEPWRVCFYTSWAQYRSEPATFVPEDIDPSLCSHIFFAFSNTDPDNNHQLIGFEPNDVDMINRINALKNQNPDLKTGLAIGGWTYGTAKMTLLMSSRENRTAFINSAISTARQLNLDGIDLDFEYPANRGSPAIDKAQFTCLVEEMRAAFEAENPTNRLFLSAGVGAGMMVVPQAYDILRICDAVDRINLMSYDFFGIWDPQANPHSALFGRADQSSVDQEKCVSFSAAYWVSNGCARSKINIGMATYGRGFLLQNPLLASDPGAPVDGGSNPGPFTGQEGILSYYEICDLFPDRDTMWTWEPSNKVPYAANGDQWVGFEMAASLTTKVEWLREEGYGGYMVWSLDFDDFDAISCGEGKYPLITALNQAIAGYVVPEDVVVPPEPFPSIPPADDTFCTGRENGFHVDPYTCRRAYFCNDGQTTVQTCTNEGDVYINPPNCQPYDSLTEEELCLNCYESCQCATLITPLSDVNEL